MKHMNKQQQQSNSCPLIISDTEASIEACFRYLYVMWCDVNEITIVSGNICLKFVCED